MIFVKLRGGLGNQLFEYAFGRSVADRLATELVFDVSEYQRDTLRAPSLEPFAIRGRIATMADEKIYKNAIPSRMVQVISRRITMLRPLLNRHYCVEPYFHFYPEALEKADGTYFDGYWQSEKYFKKIADSIRNEISLKKEYDHLSESLLQSIQNPSSVSLHIRRGDYVSNPHTLQTHGLCSLDYYQSAINYITQKVSNPHFFVFSDDMTWVKNNLFLSNVTYVSDGTLKDYEELMLMKYCQHHIIANSSFSWWGAWLNPCPGKIVIAPKKWFNNYPADTKDLLPEEWIKL